MARDAIGPAHRYHGAWGRRRRAAGADVRWSGVCASTAQAHEQQGCATCRRTQRTTIYYTYIHSPYPYQRYYAIMLLALLEVLNLKRVYLHGVMKRLNNG